MMMVDAELQFSKDQAVSAAADSANVIDLAGVDHGKGEPVMLYVHANGYTGGTLKVDLKTAAGVTGAVLASPITLATFNVEAPAMTRGGLVVSAALPMGIRRYVGLSYTPTGGGAAGKITAGLTLGTQTNT